MGCNPFRVSSSSFDSDRPCSPLVPNTDNDRFGGGSPQAPNPDPNKYTICGVDVINGYRLVFIVYEDCTNFEGKKLLLFEKGITRDVLEAQGSIDPHFSENKNFISPIARFEPTERGYEMALALMRILP